MSWLKEIEGIITRKKIEETEKTKERQIRVEENKEKQKEGWEKILNKIEKSTALTKWEDFHIDSLLKDIRDLLWPDADIRIPRIQLFFKNLESPKYLKKLIFCNKKDLLSNFRKVIATNPDNIMNYFKRTQNRFMDKALDCFMFKPSGLEKVIENKIDPNSFKYFKIRGLICTPEIVEEKIASDFPLKSYLLHEHFVLEFTKEEVSLEGIEIERFPLKEITSADVLKEKVSRILKSQLSF